MMIGLGQLPTLGNTSNRLYELRLAEEIATVDDKEAEQGAIHSDSLHLAHREREVSPGYSRTGLAQKVSRLWLSLKPQKTSTKARLEERENDDPIARARAQSITGKNAPLGWLTLDNLKEYTSSVLWGDGDGKVGKPRAELESPDELSLPFLQSDPEDDDYLFNGEWFLSPNS